MPDIYDWIYEIRVNTLHQITQIHDFHDSKAGLKIIPGGEKNWEEQEKNDKGGKKD